MNITTCNDCNEFHKGRCPICKQEGVGIPPNYYREKPQTAREIKREITGIEKPKRIVPVDADYKMAVPLSTKKKHTIKVSTTAYGKVSVSKTRRNKLQQSFDYYERRRNNDLTLSAEGERILEDWRNGQ